MKSLIVAVLLILSNLVYASNSCKVVADKTPAEKTLELFGMTQEQLDARLREQQEQTQRQAKLKQEGQNAEYAASERAKKRALQAVKNFAEYSALSQNIKLDLVMFHDLYVMKYYKAEIISLKFEDVKDPQQKAYLIKARRAVVDDEGGFDFRDDLGSETATFGSTGMTVKFLVAADGLILGADVRAEQWLVYTADVEGAPTHFNTEKEVRDAGFQVGPERYIGHAYLNEKAEIIKFSQMSYDH